MSLINKNLLIFPSETEIPTLVKIENPIHQTEYLINGVLHNWSGDKQEVFSPISVRDNQVLSPKLIGSYPLLTEKESFAALTAASEAYNHGQGKWPTMSVIDRIKHLEAFIGHMQQQKASVVNLLMWEIAKTYPDAEKEFDRTVAYIKDTIEALKDLDRSSSRFSIEEGIIGQIRRAPLGVVLCMGPYNYPLNETFTTLIPALIMGNTVIFKPPKLGVLLHQPLLTAFQKSFPPGVVNTVYGEGKTVVSPLMQSGKIDVLAFIGSSRVADILKKQHPYPHRLRCILGLEAKNPAIILSDADLDNTVKECVLGSLSYNGQRCTALKIIFAHKNIVSQFLERFTQAVNKLKIGMPWEPNVSITPLPEPNKTDYLLKLVEDSIKYGAKVVNEGGGTVNETLFSPAVLYPVNEKMRVYQEEQFGPIVPVVAFEDIEEVIDYIVKSNYGQQVSIFGNDSEVIARLIDVLVNQVCRVNINSQCQRGPDKFPFTGRKDSAEATLSVSDALRAFSIRALVVTKENDVNKTIVKKILLEHYSNFLNTDFIF
ncbi:MAG: glyceraldehyde-3-phosphate dehydrogenase (NADP) [bacterium]|nr:MAG: glyceraldehyde-3-phosphate dehydrogenase (NADP) [bacterium]